jgi:hypothetical protein
MLSHVAKGEEEKCLLLKKPSGTRLLTKCFTMFLGQPEHGSQQQSTRVCGNFSYGRFNSIAPKTHPS